MTSERAEDQRAQSDQGRGALAFIVIAVWLEFLAQSIAFPILPRLAQRLLAGDLAAAARWTGILEVAWAIPQFFAAPLLGMLSDRFGRRPVIILSVLGVGAELVLNALAPNLGWLLAGRILCGFTCGGLSAAAAYVADVTPEEGRAGRFAWINAAVWAGVIGGPALGGALSAIDIRAPFAFAAAIALVAGLYGLVVLPESLPRTRRTPFDLARANPWGALDLLLRRRGLLRLGIAQLAIWLAFQGSSNMLVLYTAHRYGWTPLAFGVFVTALAAANIVVQSGFTGLLVRRIGERRAALAGFAIQAASLVGAGVAPSARSFWAATMAGVPGSIGAPALQAMMSARVGADDQGRLQGAIGSIASLTSIIAPLAFTQAFAWSIAPGRQAAWSGATILAAATLTSVAWIIVAGSPRAKTPNAALR